MSELVDRSILAQQLAPLRRTAVFTHVRPDSDALGAQVALSLLLTGRGAACSILTLSELPSSLQFLAALAPTPPKPFSPAWAREHAGAALDGVIVVDTSALEQMEPAREFLTALADKVLVVDHHLAGNMPCRSLWRDTSAAACVEMIAELFEVWQTPLQRPAATALLAGLAGDTGWFRFDNVTPRTHELAARLLRAGAAPAEIYAHLAQRESRAKLDLIQTALRSLQWFYDDRLAVMRLAQADLTACRAAPWQTEGLVDLPLTVASVVVVVLLTETPEGVIRASLRSKRDVDVNRISGRFGGGGHARAAGCRVPGPMPAAQDALVRCLAESFQAEPCHMGEL